MRHIFFSLLVTGLIAASAAPAAAARPEVGEKARDFQLKTLDGKAVRLSEVTGQGPVVLLALRGYPGYQCPQCNRQVHEYIGAAKGFAELGAKVVLVYPGPPGELDAKAREFTADKSFPAHFIFLLDPDYKFTNLYDIRWNEGQQTAYPSTFLIDKAGVIFYVHISDNAGNRTQPAAMIELLKQHAAR